MLVLIVEEDFKMVCVRIWDMTQKEILLSFVMIARPFQFLEKKRSKIRKRAVNLNCEGECR